MPLDLSVSSTFGSQSMAAPLRLVIMSRAGPAMRGADHADWNYKPHFDAGRAERQHDGFAELIAASGATIAWLEGQDGLADSVFTHDPSLVTDHGAMILSMGKALRVPETALHEAAYARLGVPILGRIEPPGTVEGGDCVWVDRKTLAVGRGVRTNEAGIRQLSDLLAPHGITVLGFDLPLWQGEEACLHLMSVISPVDYDLAVVYSPLLPVPFRELLLERGWQLVEVPDAEFQTMGANVLALGPRRCLLLAGNPETRRRLEARGAEVVTYLGNEISVKGGGGPTCLTRPVVRGS